MMPCLGLVRRPRVVQMGVQGSGASRRVKALLWPSCPAAIASGSDTSVANALTTSGSGCSGASGGPAGRSVRSIPCGLAGLRLLAWLCGWRALGESDSVQAERAMIRANRTAGLLEVQRAGWVGHTTSTRHALRNLERLSALLEGRPWRRADVRGEPPVRRYRGALCQHSPRILPKKSVRLCLRRQTCRLQRKAARLLRPGSFVPLAACLCGLCDETAGLANFFRRTWRRPSDDRWRARGFLSRRPTAVTARAHKAVAAQRSQDPRRRAARSG